MQHVRGRLVDSCPAFQHMYGASPTQRRLCVCLLGLLHRLPGFYVSYPRGVRDTDRFFPRDAMLVRVLAMCRLVSVCVCPCLSQVGVLSKRLNESNAWELPFTRPTLREKEIHSGISEKNSERVAPCGLGSVVE